MFSKLPPLFGVLFACSAAMSQVASHTPTLPQQSPASAQSKMTTLAPSAKTVATVNGAALTEADLVREEYAIFPYARQHNGIPKDLEGEIRQGAMKMMVFEELVYQEALRRKMTIPAAKLTRAEIDFRKQFATPEDFNTLMQTEFHGSGKALQQKIERSLLIDQLLGSEVKSRSFVSPAEVRAFYDKNPARFRVPESYVFQTISVIPPANATAEQLKDAHARAEKEQREAKATKTNDEFGLLAEKASDDDYRVMEGQHKATPIDQLPPPVLTSLAAMKVGDVSGVIQVGQILTILRLNDHTPAGKQRFEDVKGNLAKQLQQNKTNQLRAALDEKLRKTASIEER